MNILAKHTAAMGLVLVVVGLPVALAVNNERERVPQSLQNRCAARGGVLVRSVTGYVCIKRESLVGADESAKPTKRKP